METRQAAETMQYVFDEMSKVIVGQNNAIRQLVIALAAGGHALLEGVPGTAKTLLVRALARSAGTSFKRIQFTPDLMPTDVLGVNVYNQATSSFDFQPGPVFGDVILGDEINRAPAKTQAALLEAMEERQVTIDGKRHAMSPVFTVFATQNPVEFEGTYPLPEAQVDRFMLKILLPYPPEENEQQILDLVEEGFNALDLDTSSLEPILDAETLSELRSTIRNVRVEEPVRRYATSLVRSTRDVAEFSLGASPRAAVMLMLAAKANAVLEDREFVTPDDVKAIAVPVLRHRVLLRPEAEIEGRTTDEGINSILQSLEVPR